MTNQCEYEFSWSRKKEQQFGQYGDIKYNQLGEEKEISGSIDDIQLQEHQCPREAETDSNRCVWHTQRSGKSTKDIKSASSNKQKLVCEPHLEDCTLNGSDLTEFSFLWANFDDAELSNVNLSNMILFYSSFENAELDQVDFSGSDLSGSRFVDATFDNSTFTKEKTDFQDSVCKGTNFIDADFKDSANFKSADFDRSSKLCRDLIDANFCNADLSETEFADLVLTGADLRGANMSNATINADFTNANLTNVFAFDANLSGSTLERAVLDGANLQSTELVDTKLHSAVISDAIIDHDTNFDSISKYEKESVSRDDKDAKVEQINRAIWTYNSLSNLSKDNALSKQAQEYYIKEKDLKRRLSWIQLCGPVSTDSDGFSGLMTRKAGYIANLLTPEKDSDTDFHLRFGSQIKKVSTCIKSELSRLTINYGEGHRNVLASLGFTTLIYSFIYPIWGINQGGDMIKYSSPIDAILSCSVEFDLELWFTSLYFSIVTFTTLGYGDIQPEGFSRYVAASEAVIGASLMALLVFVLGRRATW
ncbi:pentapeptide repeat-containing protein [Haloarchaeobius sp. HME9146]|uniref:pentapeptide repeat-containing protein n=1 Tax=Haloarchaeobius sp. HME9146 TaxID=2978732 RepID=UPI0021C0C77F|nr:pentapeptide repeat-containing protein [Haloarchaeobius sp. HME9146]MCT9096824.1 pentapeptide repeat-containing protein [Haloarchaeobius sp. HME9146]